MGEMAVGKLPFPLSLLPLPMVIALDIDLEPMLPAMEPDP